MIHNTYIDASTGVTTEVILDGAAGTATVTVDGQVVSVSPLTAQQQTQLAVIADADARQQKGTAVGQAVTTLRQWADDAAATTVTNGNNNAVTQTVVTRLGVFFDRFADLIEAQGLDR